MASPIRALGNALASDFTWTFTTAAAPPPPPNEGPGGPILVIGSTVDPFSRYYAEILRAEGLNSFTVTDIIAGHAAVLDAHDVVILGDIPVYGRSGHDVDQLGDCRRKPHRDASGQGAGGLLGLADASATVAEGYLPSIRRRARAPASSPDNAVPRHGGSIHARTSVTSVATLHATPTTHCEPGGHAPQRRIPRRPGGRVHL